MKKSFMVFLVVSIFFFASGCSHLDKIHSISDNTETVFRIEDYNLQITADNSFYQEPVSNFDLRLSDSMCYISVMAYQYIDLAENSTPLDIYDFHNEDIFSRRDNVDIIEDTKNYCTPHAMVTQTTYSADHGNIKNHYVSYLVDFQDKKTFAWILVTTLPSYLDKNRERLNNIVCSLEYME